MEGSRAPTPRAVLLPDAARGFCLLSLSKLLLVHHVSVADTVVIFADDFLGASRIAGDRYNFGKIGRTHPTSER